MNHIKKILLIIIFIFCFFYTDKVLADVILPGRKIIERCVKFENLNQFSDVVLFVYETGPLIKEEEGYRTYEINNNTCLTKEYKVNQLQIYWSFKDKKDSKKLLLNNDEIGDLFEEISEKENLQKKEVYFSIIKFNNGIKAYKSKEIKFYNDGKIKKEEYKNPYSVVKTTEVVDLKKPQNKINLKQEHADLNNGNFQKNNSWLSLFFCLIKKIFSQKCE